MYQRRQRFVRWILAILILEKNKRNLKKAVTPKGSYLSIVIHFLGAHLATVKNVTHSKSRVKRVSWSRVNYRPRNLWPGIRREGPSISVSGEEGRVRCWVKEMHSRHVIRLYSPWLAILSSVPVTRKRVHVCMYINISFKTVPHPECCSFAFH